MPSGWEFSLPRVQSAPPRGAPIGTCEPWARRPPAGIVDQVKSTPRRARMSPRLIVSIVALLVAGVAISTPATAQTHAQTHAFVA